MIVYTRSQVQNIREWTGTQYRVVGQVAPRDRVTILDGYIPLIGKDAWVPVQAVNAVALRGFMLGSLLTTVSPNPIPPIPVPPTGWSGIRAIGLHSPADPSLWAYTDQVWDAVRTARLECFKVLAASDVDGSVVLRAIREGVPKDRIIARVFNSIYPGSPKDGVQFVREVEDAILRLYAAGVRFFEIFNEPNLRFLPDGTGAPEGMDVSWRNGAEFAREWIAARDYLRPRMPEAKFGFPAVSPGVATPYRYDPELFLRESWDVLTRADFVAQHVYWDNMGLNWQTAIQEIRGFASRIPSQLVLVTEFANVNPYIPKDQKGDEYVNFYREAKRSLPGNVGGLFSFCVSSSYGFGDHTWLNSPIPGKVGERDF